MFQMISSSCLCWTESSWCVADVLGDTWRVYSGGVLSWHHDTLLLLSISFYFQSVWVDALLLVCLVLVGTICRFPSGWLCGILSSSLFLDSEQFEHFLSSFSWTAATLTKFKVFDSVYANRTCDLICASTAVCRLTYTQKSQNNEPDSSSASVSASESTLSVHCSRVSETLKLIVSSLVISPHPPESVYVC